MLRKEGTKPFWKPNLPCSQAKQAYLSTTTRQEQALTFPPCNTMLVLYDYNNNIRILTLLFSIATALNI